MANALDLESKLMRMIVLSGKATGKLLQAIEIARTEETAKAQALLTEANELNAQAYSIQTELIQMDAQGSSAVSMLAVHAQDHLMNSYLLGQLAESIIGQSEHIQALERRVVELERR